MPRILARAVSSTVSAHASAPVSGVLLPLSSLRTTRSWGIGDIGDLAPTAEWLAAHAHTLLQLLPIHEVAPGETSPYSALSAYAIDPIYAALDGLEDAADARRDEADTIARLEASPTVRFDEVRALKQRVLARAFAVFRARVGDGSAEAKDFARFRAHEATWLEDFALYRAIKDEQGLAGWDGWPAPLREHAPTALVAAEARLAGAIELITWTQWLLHAQWRETRTRLRSLGVALKGDLPFMVNRDSSDVWAHRDLFRLDASVGAPPDAFSAEGQDWGLPAFDWDVMKARDFSFFSFRARRAAALFDVVRVDHVIGLYRTWVHTAASPKGAFYPRGDGTPEQIALGEKVLAAMKRPDLVVCAEDLGVIPDWARASMQRVGVPGYRVFRWERRWKETAAPFIDPATYPELSFAVSGTHDTEPLATWYDALLPHERFLVGQLPTGHGRALDPSADYDARTRRTVLEAIYSARSRWVVSWLGDLCGWRDRINVPATVGAHNWTWRLPAPLSALAVQPDVAEAMREAAELARARAARDTTR